MVLDGLVMDRLVCPIDRRTRLVPADRTVLDALNLRIGKGLVVDRNGNRVERSVDAALVRDDGSALYRIDDGIPLLTPGSAIPLAAGSRITSKDKAGS